MEMDAVFIDVGDHAMTVEKSASPVASLPYSSLWIHCLEIMPIQQRKRS